jgi:DNA-binding MarR family transcriptional regulator
MAKRSYGAETASVEALMSSGVVKFFDALNLATEEFGDPYVGPRYIQIVMYVVNYAAQHPHGPNPTEIANELSLARPTVTRLLMGLEKKPPSTKSTDRVRGYNMVERHMAPDDLRSFRFTPTRKAKAFAERLTGLLSAV